MSRRLHFVDHPYALVFGLCSVDLSTGDFLGCSGIALLSTVVGDCKGRFPKNGAASAVDVMGISGAGGMGMASVAASLFCSE